MSVRRWNGWADEGAQSRLPAEVLRLLQAEVGVASPLADATLADVVTEVAPSRLPDHPLISHDAEDRVRHARGQSLPDWIALRSGRLEAVPDGVGRPSGTDDVRELLAFAGATGANVIPFGGGTSVVGGVTARAWPHTHADDRARSTHGAD